MKAPKNPLKKLSKLQLLELLAQQERELQSLRTELEARNAQLADRHLQIARCGSIAEAALALNGVFEAAQNAADQYLLSLKKEAAVPSVQEEGTV